MKSKNKVFVLYARFNSEGKFLFASPNKSKGSKDAPFVFLPYHKSFLPPNNYTKALRGIVRVKHVGHMKSEVELHIKAHGEWHGLATGRGGGGWGWIHEMVKEVVAKALDKDRQRIIGMIKREWALPPVLMESTLKKIEDPTRRKK
jgi:hypothetical protein